MQGYQVQIYTIAVRVTKPWIISILTEAVSKRILSIETVMKGFQTNSMIMSCQNQSRGDQDNNKFELKKSKCQSHNRSEIKEADVNREKNKT